MNRRQVKICPRCAEPLRDPNRPCIFCREERVHEAVTKLVSSAGSAAKAALTARVDAIDTLRSLGFSREQVLLARANAIDGHSVEEILDGLAAVVELEAVA